MKYSDRLRDYLPLVLAWVSILLFTGLYWIQIESGIKNQHRIALNLAHQGLSQTSHALATQTETMLRKLDYIAQNLSAQWLQLTPTEFKNASLHAQKFTSKGAIVNVLVTDATGKVLFSGLDSQVGEIVARGETISDREHFQYHFQKPLRPAELFISKPIMGRISQEWAVMMTRPIEANGQRLGVLVLSVSAKYLSQALKQVYDDPQDTALIVREDGHYLARSFGIEKVLGTAVPPDREFVSQVDRISGTYEVVSPIDGISRIHAWHRLKHYPLVVSVGASADKVLSGVNTAKTGVYSRGMVSGLILLALMLGVSYLQFKGLRQAKSLRIAHQRLHATLHSTHHGSWSWHAQGARTTWDEGADKLLQLPSTPAANKGFGWLNLMRPEDQRAWSRAWHQFLNASDQQAFAQEIRLSLPDNKTIWVDVRARVAERDTHNRASLVVGTYTDVTQKHLADDLLRLERKRLDVLLESFPGGVLMEDPNERIVLMNRLALQWLGLDDPDTHWVGQTHCHLLAQLGPNANYLTVPPELSGQTHVSFEVENQHDRVLEVTRIHIYEQGEPFGCVWLLYDVTNRKQRERKLTTLASTDTLTGLPNRRAFMSALETAIASSTESQAPCMVLMMDVDHFKKVNDTYGHAVGDEVLMETATRIRACLRQKDVAGRLGGEEFAVVLENIPAQMGRRKAEAICELISAAPFMTTAGPISVTISIGLAASTHHTTAESILANADKALYEAKHQGRNRVVG